MYNNTENYGDPVLTPDERATMMNIINETLEKKHINLDAIGYEDLYGMFSVYFMKKEKDKPVKDREEKFCPVFYEES